MGSFSILAIGTYAASANFHQPRDTTKKDRAYWKSIKDYFRDVNAVRSRRVVFDKRSDAFNRSAKAALAMIAANAKPGAIASPTRITERLISNLVPVAHLAPRLFLAETQYKDNKAFGAASRALETDAPGEWIVKNGRVLSFHDLDTYPWSELCDVGTIDSFDTSEWALTADVDQQRDFVQLLNRALSQLTRDDLMFDRDSHMHYFKRIPGETRRAYAYDGFEKHTARNVVKLYPKKKSPTETAYWRHSAFIARFQRFGEDWYLEVTPTYHFTRDGYRAYRFAADCLKRIKEFENNNAVVGQFVMWRHYLNNCMKGDMFKREYPFLTFGMAADYLVEQGVPDKLWQSQESRQRAPLFNDELAD